MKLYLNATSPFARFARMVALSKRLELTLCWCDPWADEAELLHVNPLGRIPALHTQDGLCLSESVLIALYLDQQGDDVPLLKPEAFGVQMHLLGLGLGLMEAAFNCVIARKHHLDHGVLSVRRQHAIERTLDQLAQEPLTCCPPNLGSLCVGVALDYLAFRLPEYAFHTTHPALGRFHNAFNAQPLAQQTAFI